MARFLCFGDSLTEGYTFQPSGKFHPYSIKLEELLREHCHGEVSVTTAGVSGERVVPSMTHRLDHLLTQTKQPYDWVLILGGTNDLGMGLKAEELVPDLLKLHDRAKQSGAKTLALAIPQFRYELSSGHEAYQDTKAKVNKELKLYCEKSGSKTIYVDLWNELPFSSLPAKDIDMYWVDGLHMTSKGYDKMAGVIFDVLKSRI